MKYIYIIMNELLKINIEQCSSYKIAPVKIPFRNYLRNTITSSSVMYLLKYLDHFLPPYLQL